MLPHQHRQPPKPNQASTASKPTGMETNCYSGSFAVYLYINVLSSGFEIRHSEKNLNVKLKAQGKKSTTQGKNSSFRKVQHRFFHT